MLIRYQKAWGHSIDVEYIPFFLGGIMVGAGNKPPATVPGTLLSLSFLLRPLIS